ncbi:MAG: NADH-quinone oxidoreductase subunit L [Pirellulales bacterium]
MFDLETLLVLIPALPLAATLLTAALGPRVLKAQSHWPAVTAIIASCVLSLLLLFEVRREMEKPDRPASIGFERTKTLWTWADVKDARNESPADFNIAVTLRVDPLTAIMLATVTFVSSLIVIYSIGYMHGDPGYWRFFTYIALFVFSMTMLVSVSNFVLLYVFWEAVGLCSYLLIGFWFHKPEAAAAGKKAFLVNRVGDFGFALGVFLIWTTYGTLDFHDTVVQGRLQNAGVLGQARLGIGVGAQGSGPSRVARTLPGIRPATWLDSTGDVSVSRSDKRHSSLARLWAPGVTRVGKPPMAPGAYREGEAPAEPQAGETPTPQVVRAQAPQDEQTLVPADPPRGFARGPVALAICLLLLLGCCGKSAQFPLHVWLPDAMEGPTPVSALIHAATMVTAGVYLVARCTPLFFASPEAQWAVAAVGGFTALLAAVIAVTQTDLKRILAYSTISQLGYMFLGAGAGTLAGITAGMFHLFTHAFFKALLFLGAGSVMHAMGGVIDIRQFGGLRRRLPVTHWTFLFGCLALAGVAPFAGFWSKDAIVAALHDRAGGSAPMLYQAIYASALVTALLTAFYTFRAYFVTFYGDEKIPAEAGHHAHESPAAMTVPLTVLAICALVVGAYFEWTGGFARFLAMTPSLAYAPVKATAAPEEFHWNIAALSLVIAVSGVLAAAVVYLGGRTLLDRLTAALQPVYQLSYHKFYFDELYGALIVWPVRKLAGASDWLDRRVVDALVDLCGRLPPALGAVLRPLQTGMVQFYALAMVLGLLVLIGILLR